MLNPVRTFGHLGSLDYSMGTGPSSATSSLVLQALLVLTQVTLGAHSCSCLPVDLLALHSSLCILYPLPSCVMERLSGDTSACLLQ
jgi:hypothetical protein